MRLVLTIDDLDGEDAQTLEKWLKPIAESVGAQIRMTDDADALKRAADELGLDQQRVRQTQHVGLVWQPFDS